MVTKKKTATRTRKPVAKKTFDDIESEVSDLQNEDPKQSEIRTARRSALLSTVGGISVENAVNSITQASLSINATFSDLTKQIIEKTAEYAEIDEAIKFKEEELQAAYDKEVVAQELSAFVARFNKVKEEFEASAQAQRKSWQEEVQERATARQREQAEYEYNKTQQRKKIDDDFAQKDKERIRSQMDREEQFVKGWTERENALQAREKEFEQYKARVDNFDTEKKAAVDTAVAIATNSLKKDLTNTFTLEKKEIDTQLQLSRQQQAADAKTIDALTGEINRLRSALEAAQQKVVDISKSGFESVSGQRAMDALTNFAQNNSGTTAKTKS